MGTHQVQFTDDLNRFVTQRVDDGRYSSADEVIRAAFESLARAEEDDGEKLRILRQAIAEGDASGIARGDVIAQVKRESRRVAKRLG